jgi:hypothetical protein
LNTIIGFILGVILCALGVYFTLDWQEEKLEFSISSPAKFGKTNYQNLTLQNIGWNPAENLNVIISHPTITFINIQSDAALKELKNDKNGIANLNRLRRDETVVISLVYEGIPLTSDNIKVTSNRSIAKPVEVNSKDSFLSLFNHIMAIVTSIFSGAVLTTMAFKQWLAIPKELSN